MLSISPYKISDDLLALSIARDACGSVVSKVSFQQLFAAGGKKDIFFSSAEHCI